MVERPRGRGREDRAPIGTRRWMRESLPRVPHGGRCHAKVIFRPEPLLREVRDRPSCSEGGDGSGRLSYPRCPRQRRGVEAPPRRSLRGESESGVRRVSKARFPQCVSNDLSLSLSSTSFTENTSDTRRRLVQCFVTLPSGHASEVWSPHIMIKWSASKKSGGAVQHARTEG